MTDDLDIDDILRATLPEVPAQAIADDGARAELVAAMFAPESPLAVMQRQMAEMQAEIARLRAGAPAPAEPVELPAFNPEEEDPFEMAPLEERAISYIVVESKEEGEVVRDQDPVQRGCHACERGSVRRGAPHTCGRPNPPGLGVRDSWS